MSLVDAVSLFESHFKSKPQFASFAPGRINLIGEHTDYQEGYVFPCAIDLGLTVVASVTDGPTELVSQEMGVGKSFDCRKPNKDELRDSWSKYPAGVAKAIGAKSNIRAAVISNLPAESGVSSSAAIELAFGVLWNQIDKLGLTNKQLALKGQEAENKFVGMPCGVMDQMASAMGVDNSALLLDTRSLDIQAVKMRKGIAVVLLDTGRRRQLVGQEYAQRRSQVEEAAAKLGKKTLRDAASHELDPSKLPGLLYKRALHVVTENERCLEFAECLQKGQLRRVGELMAESHESLRENFEVTVPQLDDMCYSAAHAPGCVGVRMTGAGFGGACVALVKENRLNEFLESTENTYRALQPSFEPRLIACRASNGAKSINLSLTQ